MMKLTMSEKKVLRRIRRVHKANIRYDFWFIYVFSKCDCCGSNCWIAVDYEGGFELPHNKYFRNQYSIQHRKTLIKNWG